MVILFSCGHARGFGPISRKRRAIRVHNLNRLYKGGLSPDLWLWVPHLSSTLQHAASQTWENPDQNSLSVRSSRRREHVYVISADSMAHWLSFPLDLCERLDDPERIICML